jgi:polysaccharide biosynthesis protein PslH
LRLARGIQNKILEAMAMARPVVAAAECLDAIDAKPGEHIFGARDAEGFVASVNQVLAEPERAALIGQAGRERVLQRYGWGGCLTVLDEALHTFAMKAAA